MKKNIIASVLKNIVLILLLLLLTLTLFLFGSFSIISANITNADFYIRLADRAQERYGIYDEIYADALQTFTYRGSLSSLPDEVFEGVLTREYTVFAAKDYIRAVVDGKADEFSLQDLNQTVLDRCRAYVADHSVNISDSELVNYCNFLDEEMINSMKLPFFAKIYPYAENIFGGSLQWVVPVLSSVFISAFSVGIFFICGKRISALLRRIAACLIGGAVMTGIACLFLWLLDSAALFNFSTNVVLYYLDALKRYFAAGYTCCTALFLILGTVSAVFAYFYRKKERVSE